MTPRYAFIRVFSGSNTAASAATVTGKHSFMYSTCSPAPAVLPLFAVGDMYVSLCKRSAYAPFSAQRRSRALFWL